MKSVRLISLVLMIIGGLNWGLVGIADFNIVSALFGEQSVLSRVIYSLVGLSAVYHAVALVIRVNSHSAAH
ncbi:MAG: DUF378 domain-containing protein [Sphingobacteriia bacterium]|nr:DUF378 domain-containing protein [Sphingobacteriia bacterium]